MESDKRTKSGRSSSSEESDQAVAVEIQDGVVSSTSSNKRSYECTYCKRGFTNAQALGGHMNIHRKDRAKVKQQHPLSPNNNLSRKSEESFGGVSAVSINNNYASAGGTCYNTNPGGVEMQRGYAYDLYVPSHASCSPRSNFSLHFYECSGNLSLRKASDGNRLDANFTLGVGSNHSTSTENFEENGGKHGLDLELRLGPDP